MIFFIGCNHGNDAAILYAQRPDVHAFPAHADTPVAQNAPRPIEVDNRRPLLLVPVILDVDVFGLGRTIGKSHVLQFAFAAGIADRAIERMVPKQQFNHRLARLVDLRRIGGDDHALTDHRGAGSLQLGHLLDLDQAHAAGALQRQARVITEGGHLNAYILTRFNQQRTRRCRDLLAVNRDVHIWHKSLV